VIQRISETVVPVAINLYEFRNRPKDDQNPQVQLMGSFRYRPDVKRIRWQGMWLIDPDKGEYLGTWDEGYGWQSNESDYQRFLDWLDAALAAYGKKIEPRKVESTNPYPFRGKGVQADGSATLAVWFAGGTVDAISLSAADWAELRPSVAQAGREWTIGESAGRRFSRILSGGSDLGHKQPVRPEDVTSVTVTGKVVSVAGSSALVIYRGRITGERHNGKVLLKSEVAIQGAGEYDVKAGRLRSLKFVFEGSAARSMAEWVDRTPMPGP
jgi:hypothetical protein